MNIRSTFPRFAANSFTQGANCIVMNEDREILLIERDDIEWIKYPGYWCCPGGHIDPDESPLEAMVREVKEEVDLDVRNVAFLGHAYDPVYSGWNHYYFAKTDARSSDVVLQDGEGQGARFFSFEETKSLLLVHHAVPFIERVFDLPLPKMSETRTPPIDFPNACL